MTQHFSTYFDKNYLHRGVALYRSLLEHAEGDFVLWVVCLDDETHSLLTRLQYAHINLIHLKDLEAGEPGLAVAKANRSIIEYYWTLTPVIPLFIFRHHPEVKSLVYLDADMYFFSSPSLIFAELAAGSILIIPHDYSDDYQHERHSGIYNVGIMGFASDAQGIACLEWWQERCIEWCYGRHENGNYGDQGYLNDWPDRFDGVVVSRNIGVRLAPWNIGKFTLMKDTLGRLAVDDLPVIVFHFHDIEFCTPWLVLIAKWPINMSGEWKEAVYTPYIEMMRSIESELAHAGIHVPIPMTGFPWRYIGGRIFKWQPLRHFIIGKE